MMKAKLMTAALVVMAGASLADAKKPTAEEKARAEQVKQECDALHKELSQTSHGHYGYGVYSVGFAYRYGVFDGETWSEEKIAAAERRALEIRRRLVELRPGDVREHLELGALLMYFGQERNDAALFKEALAEMEKAAGLVTFVKGKNDRLFAETRFWLADAQFAAGDRAAAQATLESVVEKKLNTWQRHAADWARYASDALLALKGNSFDRMELPLGNDARAFPEPQQAKYTEDFTRLGDVLLKLDGIDEDDVRIRLLRTKLSRIGAKVEVAGLFGGLFSGAYPISVALDPEAPVDKPEGYSLTVGADGVSIRARDRQGVLWGIVSTIQLVNRDTRSIRHCEISDWPDTKDRGWLNNFFADATEYILFVKGNSCCHQHNPTEGNYMTPLRTFMIAEQAREYKAFGLTLYYGLRWISHCEQLAISEPRTLPFCIEVCKRYAKMGAGVYYPLDDVRFPMLKTDKEKFGTAANCDAKHVNAIFQGVVSEYPDFRMIFCPPFYWGPDAKAGYPEDRETYLKSIGEHLDPRVDVYWTGSQVKGYEKKKYQVEWFTNLTKHKPSIFQNVIAPHNHLDYGVDPIPWSEIHYDGFCKDISVFHNNSNHSGEANLLATECDWLWNSKAYDAKRSVRIGVSQYMGPGVTDILAEGLEDVAYFDKYPYGQINQNIMYEDVAELERKYNHAKDCWERACAQVKKNGRGGIQGRFGSGVDWAGRVLKQAKNPPDFLSRYKKDMAETRERAIKETGADEKAGDLVYTPMDMNGLMPSHSNGRFVKWMRGANSGACSLSCRFECDPFPPTGDYTLEVCGLQDELKDETNFKVIVNGQTVYDGPSGFPAARGNLAFGKKIDFEVRKFKIPFASMKRQNNLTIACSSPGYNKLGTPYIGVNYIVLKKSK